MYMVHHTEPTMPWNHHTGVFSKILGAHHHMSRPVESYVPLRNKRASGHPSEHAMISRGAVLWCAISI